MTASAGKALAPLLPHTTFHDACGNDCSWHPSEVNPESALATNIGRSYAQIVRSLWVERVPTPLPLRHARPRPLLKSGFRRSPKGSFRPADVSPPHAIRAMSAPSELPTWPPPRGHRKKYRRKGYCRCTVSANWVRSILAHSLRSGGHRPPASRRGSRNDPSATSQSTDRSPKS